MSRGVKVRQPAGGFRPRRVTHAAQLRCQSCQAYTNGWCAIGARRVSADGGMCDYGKRKRASAATLAWLERQKFISPTERRELARKSQSQHEATVCTRRASETIDGVGTSNSHLGAAHLPRTGRSGTSGRATSVPSKGRKSANTSAGVCLRVRQVLETENER